MAEVMIQQLAMHNQADLVDLAVEVLDKMLQEHLVTVLQVKAIEADLTQGQQTVIAVVAVVVPVLLASTDQAQAMEEQVVHG